ncbi:hypothetical protein EPA93_36245 [Ktedonosporobacter rubrisoli]|uniref:Uncharacterized protein n=1 Tax=Ktedonosporobacter rubrisoli TaxID=2509675 RepID=A0A4P6JZG7_KTERU|nr:hypothetical protein [Ktedonosporobacter rubrisoli]QBD75086.1 hypothetical protein EPA93_03380 [Ktedonosporobacter rubrisoli]QBD75633.1 hypothetical protein EPA93_06285 [Ktedonosporobacter rubrisoli]QBD77710.1 hypothetical protein EPA93_17610 [Ktedonosporobacter rubrisoli]QBD81134.1 hypothetical protein EPA93_36245 [Ktedonosporobacter rubrisoli]
MRIQVSLTLELNASADLSQMEAQIQEAGQSCMRQALKKAVGAWEQAHRSCPRCGSQLVRTEGTIPRSILTLFGPVDLTRRRFRCQRCQRRFTPSGILLAGLQLRRVRAPLKEAAVLAGASWPYRHAAAWLARLRGAHISAEEIRLLTNQAGASCAQRHLSQASQQLTSPPAPAQAATANRSSSPQELAVIGLDGGWVCSREQRGGMEGKVGVIASGYEGGKEPEEPNGNMTWFHLARYVQSHRHPPRVRSRWNTRRYVATFASSRILGTLAAQALQELGLASQPQVVVADGAGWIKKETDTHFPEAQRILDWPHLWRTMRKAANAVRLLRACSAKAHAQQVEHLGTWLWNGQVERAQALLETWRQELAARQGPAGPALRQAITSLQQQRDWIGSYQRWKEQGFPVGSGIIERAVALVINRRMKRRGMRWLRTNASAVVALRVDLLNADWQRPRSSRCFP